MSKNFLTVVHIVIQNGSNNGDIHRSLKKQKYKINIFYNRNLREERKTQST